ncbi:TPA: hypothetical protein I8Y73_001163 [Legionella pneumophila]|nr:hypothetical protein [Legionella pneumophila]
MENTTGNLYTTMLEFGVSKMRDGLTFNEMLAHLKELGLLNDGSGGSRLKATFDRLFETEMVATELGVIKEDENTRYILKASAFFSFLQFKEYQLSITAAREARTYAIWAIGIAIVTLVVSTVFSIINVFVCY